MKLADHISPSLICTDLCNIERDVKTLQAGGIGMLHVDIVDGYFSPSMPMGLDVVRKVRGVTDMLFDSHIMAVDNTYFLEELVDIGVWQLCFQAETERHICRRLTFLKNKGVRAGVALTPATPLNVLEYALELCDFVLLMRINPGFAGFGGESDYPFMNRKIRDLKDMINTRGLDCKIELDGRVRTEDIGALRRLGADIFVAGTACLFKKGRSLEENIAVLADELRDA